MSNKGFIYSLCDPTTNEIRYVGQTINSTYRYKQHLSRSKESNNYKCNWIECLRSQNKLPMMKILIECDRSMMNFYESIIIEQYKKSCKLTNTTSGGSNSKNGTCCRNKQVELWDIIEMNKIQTFNTIKECETYLGAKHLYPVYKNNSIYNKRYKVIDVNGELGYITRQEHASKTYGKCIEYKGTTYSIAELSRLYGIGHSTLRYRINHGWSIEKAVGQ